MEKGQNLRVRIEDMTAEGQGLGKSSDGYTVFVKDGILGETLDVELTKVKKNYAFGTIVEVVEESSYRAEPYCEYMGRCGGCTYGKLSYEGQLMLKEKQVKDKIIRLGGIENPKINSIVPAPDCFRYRNKATLPVSTGGIITKKGGIMTWAGPLAIGFNQAKSHNVIDCYDCKIQSEPAMAAAQAVRQFMTEDNITAYDPKWDKGLMKHIVVKTAMNTGQVMVILVVNGNGIPNQDKLIEMLDDAVFNVEPREDGIEYELASVVVNVKKKHTPEIMGPECLTIAGKPVIEERVGELKFEISPLSFYQVNPAQMEVLYDKAIEYADLKGKETVLDVYCGVGTIGIFAAKKMENIYKETYGKLDYEDLGYVYGIESVKGAVVDANRNTVINGIINARYVCGRAEEVLPEMVGLEINADRKAGGEADSPADGRPDGKDVAKKSNADVRLDDRQNKTDGKDVADGIRIEKADVVFLDPPRSGCEESVLDAVVKVEPTKIVYVSCDPATLARDIKYLETKGYKMVEATPVDMFPGTVHVESIILMTYCGSEEK